MLVGRNAINEAIEAAAEEAMQRRTALAEARKDAKAARDKQRDEELKRLMKECAQSPAPTVAWVLGVWSKDVIAMS